MTDPQAKGARRVSEAHIQETVVSLLVLDGWRAFRTELTVQRERGRVVGERGQPDYLFLRYGPTVNTPGDCVERAMFTQAFWIEFKAPGKTPPQHQLAWHEAERARGALVLVVDSIDGFMAWYENSGLARSVVRKNRTTQAGGVA